MLSLFRGPTKATLQVRRDHIADRDRALCVPINNDAAALDGTASSLADLPSSEIALQDGDLDILNSDLSALVEGVLNKAWTSTRMVQAFIRSARRAHRATNCITVPNFTAALAKAKELDEHFDRTGSVVGPLHGVPFSAKENNYIKGLTTTIGYTSWVLDGPATQDASLAQMAQHLGGIVICKTNIPQTMLSFECYNPLYGRTLNPYSDGHTCGGSSGGEAALLACDGAALGFGSDIAGSLRIPSGFCGIYALKPSAGRFPGGGTRSARAGFEGISTVFAPMCRSAGDLELMTRELIPLIHPSSDSPIDPGEAQRCFGSEELRPAPLRTAWFEPLKAAGERPIRIGYYACDGFARTTPASVRAVQTSVDAVRATYGDRVELVEIDPARLRAKEAMHIFLAQVTSDKFDGLLGPLKKGNIRDPMDLSLFLPVFAARAPRWIKAVFYWVAKYVLKDPHTSYLLTAGGNKSAGEYFEHVGRRRSFEKTFLEDVWRHYQLDGIICPLQASPAVSHGGCAKLSSMASATVLYNVTDCAAAVCPVVRVDASLDKVPPKDAADERSGWHATRGFDTCAGMIDMTLYGQGVYDAEKMAGMPVSVQVVAKKNEEEKAIGLLRLVDDALAVQKTGGRHLWGPGGWTQARLRGSGASTDDKSVE